MFYCIWQECGTNFLKSITCVLYKCPLCLKCALAVPKQIDILIPLFQFVLRKAPAAVADSEITQNVEYKDDSWVFLVEGSFYRAPSPWAEGFIRIPFSSWGALMFPSQHGSLWTGLLLLYNSATQTTSTSGSVCRVHLLWIFFFRCRTGAGRLVRIHCCFGR